MLTLHSRSTVTVSLSLSYLLVILLCTPFAASGGPSVRKARGSAQDQLPARYRAGELLIRFRDGVNQRDKDTIINTYGARRKRQLKGESGLEQLELGPGRDSRAAAFDLLQNPQVQFAEPNFLISKEDVTPNDPQFNQQWALQNTGQGGGQYGSDIKAGAAWNTTAGSRNTVIAVI